MAQRQIIALGGGGFSMEPENPLLDQYVLHAVGKPNPRICFIPTASGDSDQYIVNFYSAFGRLRCRPSHLSLFRLPTADLRSFLLSQDAVYVGGGNTKSLMALWREWGLDEILRQAWEEGVVLAGISAGCNCWFEQCVTDSIPGRMSVLSCLGLLPGSACPHYDGESDRRPNYLRMVAEGEISGGIALDDGAAAHFVGLDLHATVSSRPQARAYRVERRASEAVEQALPIRYLGPS
jgi:dipeptidase E